MEMQIPESDPPMFEKALLVFNPTAGSGVQLPPFIKKLFGLRQRQTSLDKKHDQLLLLILESLGKHNIRPQVMKTQAGGETGRTVKSLLPQGYDCVIVVGGDGTINEVVNAMAGSDVPLGVIATGTANVFANTLDLPVEIDEACRVIAEGCSQWFDLGRCNGRYFACMCGVGYDAYVIQQTTTKLKRTWGALAYVFIAVVHMLFYRFRKIVVQLETAEGLKRHEAYFVIFFNGKFYAGDKILAPDAEVTDGELDACIFTLKNFNSLYLYLLGMRRQDARGESSATTSSPSRKAEIPWSDESHRQAMPMKVLRFRRAIILPPGNHHIHVDGEFFGHTRAEIQVCSNALKVLVPKENLQKET